MNRTSLFPNHNDTEGPRDHFELVSADIASPVDDPKSSDLRESSAALHAAGVREIILVHGTFAGNDLVGLMRWLARLSPQLSLTLKALGKQWFDQLADEVGNYTDDYADLLGTIRNRTKRSESRDFTGPVRTIILDAPAARSNCSTRS